MVSVLTVDLVILLNRILSWFFLNVLKILDICVHFNEPHTPKTLPFPVMLLHSFPVGILYNKPPDQHGDSGNFELACQCIW